MHSCRRRRRPHAAAHRRQAAGRRSAAGRLGQGPAGGHQPASGPQGAPAAGGATGRSPGSRGAHRPSCNLAGCPGGRAPDCPTRNARCCAASLGRTGPAPARPRSRSCNPWRSRSRSPFAQPSRPRSIPSSSRSRPQPVVATRGTLQPTRRSRSPSRLRSRSPSRWPSPSLSRSRSPCSRTGAVRPTASAVVPPMAQPAGWPLPPQTRPLRRTCASGARTEARSVPPAPPHTPSPFDEPFDLEAGPQRHRS